MGRGTEQHERHHAATRTWHGRRQQRTENRRGAEETGAVVLQYQALHRSHAPRRFGSLLMDSIRSHGRPEIAACEMLPDTKHTYDTRNKHGHATDTHRDNMSSICCCCCSSHLDVFVSPLRVPPPVLRVLLRWCSVLCVVLLCCCCTIHPYVAEHDGRDVEVWMHTVVAQQVAAASFTREDST